MTSSTAAADHHHAQRARDGGRQCQHAKRAGFASVVAVPQLHSPAEGHVPQAHVGGAQPTRIVGPAIKPDDRRPRAGGVQCVAGVEPAVGPNEGHVVGPTKHRGFVEGDAVVGEAHHADKHCQQAQGRHDRRRP
jgi:hypothetical protein